MRSSRRRTSGFTLIEMMVVVAIIAILAALLLPALQGSSKVRLRLLAQESVKAIHAAATIYYEEHGRFPPDTDDFETGEVKEVYVERESIYRYLGRVIEDKATGKKYGPYLNIKLQYLKDELYLDPWGMPYELDSLHVRVVTEKGPRQGDVERIGAPYPVGTTADKQTLDCKVWSGGPDKVWVEGSNVEIGKGGDQKDADNVTSWAD